MVDRRPEPLERLEVGGDVTPVDLDAVLARDLLAPFGAAVAGDRGCRVPAVAGDLGGDPL